MSNTLESRARALALKAEGEAKRALHETVDFALLVLEGKATYNGVAADKQTETAHANIVAALRPVAEACKNGDAQSVQAGGEWGKASEHFVDGRSAFEIASEYTTPALAYSAALFAEKEVEHSVELQTAHVAELTAKLAEANATLDALKSEREAATAKVASTKSALDALAPKWLP